MRLTLRTLLAYLDDMLEEEDTQLLQAKIQESSLATELIARIRDSVDHREIGAISPDAIGPLENANVMGEYLDSTLVPEQIAEIERLCLESDSSLAEAAACHQILTVVLGQPAQFNDSLRESIYELPNSESLRVMESQTQPAADSRTSKPIPVSNTGDQATASSVGQDSVQTEALSGLDIPSSAVSPSEATLQALGLDSPNPGNMSDLNFDSVDDIQSQSTLVSPVGPDDSGVTDAPDRLRQGADIAESSDLSEAKIAARATREMLERNQRFGGNIRPSRITPWLVTLALAGVVLYVLGHIFAPLTKRHVREIGAVAMEEIDNGAQPIIDSPDATDPNELPSDSGDGVGSLDESTEMDDSGLGVESSMDGDGNEIVGENDDVEVPKESGPSSTEPSTAELPETVAPETSEPATAPESDVAMSATEAALADPAIPEVEPTMPADSADAVGSDAENGTASGSSDPATNTATNTASSLEEPATVAPEPKSTEGGTSEEPSMKDTPAEIEPPAVISVGETPMVAQMADSESLVLVQNRNGWNRLVASVEATENSDKAAEATNGLVTSIRSGQKVIAPALYRPVLSSLEGLEWTLAGPTRMKLERDSADSTVTEVSDGRLLLASTQPGVTTKLQLGPRLLKVVMPEAQTVLAVEMVHLRPVGMDPLLPQNRRPVYRIIVVQGQATVQARFASGDSPAVTEDAITLETGDQWQGRGTQPIAVSSVDILPSWIDDVGRPKLSVDSAKKGLLKFIDNDPLEKSLREAMAFRRVEVAALAAETLLLLGRADVYFGKDGILSRPRQRVFWTEHFEMLRQHIASSAEAAASIQAAVKRAELADSEALFKLLVGFTNDELKNGGDQTLVDYLDSASMPVRVLAIENLHDIIGDNLGYRADQENANTRRSDIKKWEARLRRGDIRLKP